MLFWILVAVLTAAVAIVLLLPLLRAGRDADSAEAHDAEVYRDQLDELQRDEAAGLIGRAEAELARAEIARRLIAASGHGQAAPEAAASPASERRRNRLAQVVVVVLLPAIGLCLYLLQGRPELPAQPLAARLAAPGNDLNILLAKAERHLAENPDDGAGWELLAPIYARNGRLEDAANAYSQAIRILGGSTERLDGHAEALIALADGIVTKDAREALEQSLALDAQNPRTRFYLALALEQEGKRDEARGAFEALAKDSPAEAPWLPLVNRHIASLGGNAAGQGAGQDPARAENDAPGGPTEEDVAAAGEMDAQGRQQMIEGMVDSLAARLKENPDNFEGWMRIIRSYVVLDQRRAAEEALALALKSFPPESDNGRQLLALAGELRITAGGDGQ
ncbi:c-type cytochrome biogenesis protein CcmI [Rhizobium sp. TRM96647]|uniref:c-type cytochrome biogenesis protein CcmI n=1 Tax=unclassified Rhizobium TaxID=2613769 RepID=UPI0021E94645|nr:MULTISPECIES: c-type cytochrome biogenesis protein CcmI [unclassified Rhizobium]MCV3738595.1 c-type cytochrome biogenesis protein CcmI [Rhizobium sp. TRM96647]MCV3760282.1 c-type cytochrome biogenesis protein CcmI [Rhizobium sp. TRM96650]